MHGTQLAFKIKQMKLKLIQTGGFAGKSKYAEEDLSLHPAQLQQELEQHFPMSIVQPTANKASQSRDAFEYFLEYKGIRVALTDDMKANPFIEDLLERLKDQLHY